jgi:hypothetical protein
MRKGAELKRPATVYEQYMNWLNRDSSTLFYFTPDARKFKSVAVIFDECDFLARDTALTYVTCYISCKYKPNAVVFNLLRLALVVRL